jgi:hypothetical protein
MPTEPPSGPGPDTIVQYILETYPETDVVEAYHAWFFSLDPEKHWPNYATIVTTDEHDDASNLGRPGTFRLNLGVDKATFRRIADADPEPDCTAFDTLFPHPVYARQLWISIVNPSDATFREVVVPLLALAHERLEAVRARHAQSVESSPGSSSSARHEPTP